MRSICKLVDGCHLGPGKRVLDLGCGLGGPAVELARLYGAHVTGLTNCEPHVSVATQYAQEQEVGDLVEFYYGDFMDIPFSDGTYDVAINHGSLCHVHDKTAYLEGVYKTLKPGGRWQTLDGFLTGKPLSESQETGHQCLQQNWRTAPFTPLDDFLDIMKETRFRKIRHIDLDHEVAPSGEKLAVKWRTLVFLTPPAAPEESSAHQWMQANIEWCKGLHDGVFTYRWISGTK
ncbi:MAG: methyltransferase domain-containing protein [Gammaproteobacteria bacterium]|nr:methyltransferase domain-containing protein [Gammaproteobacteria bacterium]